MSMTATPGQAAMRRDRGGNRTPPLILVQVLRGLAALFVLTGHVEEAVVHGAAEVGRAVATIPHFAGGFGVDLFFSISGFIMVVSSGQFFATSSGWHRFLLRRVIRLVPLYWFFTLFYLPILLLGKTGFHGNLPVSLATSLTFVPYATGGQAQGGVFPIYNLGWSLNYEMFFYVVFAAFLFLPQGKAVLGCLIMLACFVVGALLLRPTSDLLSVWTAPILLEFAFGLVVGMVWLGAARLPVWACLALLLAALAMLLIDPIGLSAKTATGTTPNDLSRVFGWGLPAAAILTVVTFIEKGRDFSRNVVLGWFRRIGDTSYSLYLVHSIVVLIVTKVWSVLLARGSNAAVSFASWPGMGLTLIATAIIAGFVSHHLVEKPVTQWLNRRLTSRRHPGP